MATHRAMIGNCLEVLKTLPSDSIDCCVTSPPYYSLRDYKTEPLVWDTVEGCEHEWEIGTITKTKHENEGFNERWGHAPGEKKQEECKAISAEVGFCQKCGAWRGQLGLEPTPQLYIQHLVSIFDEVKRVLKPSGTCWVNLGDSYGDKSLQQIPSRFAIAMTDRDWCLRNEIIWHKPNCMPSSVKDRFTVDFEKFFFFVKSKRYYFEPQYEPMVAPIIYERSRNPLDSVGSGKGNGQTGGSHAFGCREPRRNKRTVWTISTKPYSGAHFAVFPPELIETPIKAGCPTNGTVLDPFGGSGTTAKVARSLGRSSIIIELNPAYLELATERAMTNVPDVLSFESQGGRP